MTGRAEPLRETALEALQGELFDILVIGGGIVGAGVAREAALRGLRVGLVDRHDFAFGTSSRTSRLLHGGIRYLAQGRMGLVRQASREKKIIHHIAPHLARPLPFIFPAYRGGPYPRWKLRIGVTLYDLLCGSGNLGVSSALSVSDTVSRLPGLKREGLTGAVRYFDGLTNDARLVVDTLHAAVRHGAKILNYVEFLGAQRDGHGGTGVNWRCRLRDRLGEQEIETSCRCVVNAAGPWADTFEQSRIRLRRTKGIHLVVDTRRLPLSDAVVMLEGRRVLFAIPWNERMILGTTDTDFRGEPECVRLDAEDIAYVLKVTNAHFPETHLTESDLLGSWAGLRPLIACAGGGPSDISREHEIRSPEPGWFDVAGGKLTTYRLIGEQTVGLVLRQMGRNAPAARSAEAPLLEDAGGSEWSGVEPPAFSPRAVDYYLRNEWVEHLDDLMIRRTSWAHYLDHPVSCAEMALKWMAELKGWNAMRADEERMRYELALDRSIG